MKTTKRSFKTRKPGKMFASWESVEFWPTPFEVWSESGNEREVGSPSKVVLYIDGSWSVKDPGDKYLIFCDAVAAMERMYPVIRGTRG